MNAEARRRKYENPNDRNAWLLEDLPKPDEYSPLQDPGNPQYSKHRTGVDFRLNKHNEIAYHSNQVCRVDLVELSDGTPVKRLWLAGWEPGDKCWKAERLAEGWTVERAADHLESEGWTVRRWKEGEWIGARAFRCGLRCVRTGGYRYRWEDGVRASLHTDILDSRFDG